MQRLTILLLIIYIFTSPLSAQKYTTDSKRAIKMFKAATGAFRYTQFDKAIEYLDEALNRDDQFIEAWLLKAQVYNVLNKPKDEARAYRGAIAINELFFKFTLLNSAKAHFRSGDYEMALKHAQQFLNVPELEPKDKRNGKHTIKQIEFAINAKQNPVKIDPAPVSNLINRLGDVYWPSMTVDNSMFYFTAKLPLYRTSFQEDIYVSHMRNDTFGKPYAISDEVLSLSNEGASFISPDGRYLLFTGCRRSDGYGSCDLYMSLKKDGKWQQPVNLGSKVNSNVWDSRPVITSDGKTLYFSSNRKGGFGKADIYMCKKQGDRDDGFPKWSEPINLGDPINTPGDEFAPFIHADNQTLYFSSDYHLGLGGQDIFMTRKTGDNQWEKPQNLGYPINKHTDEIGLFIDAPAEYAYFASDDNQDRRSIFRFRVPEKIKPQYVSYVKVFVKDQESYEPLNAMVNLFDIETTETITEIRAEGKNGSALISLPGNKRYGMMVEKKGYMFYSGHFDLKSGNKNNIKKLDILLQPIKTGQSVVLNNVFFEFDSFKLSSGSKAELQRIKKFLEQNDNLYVEISGHTDNQGSSAYNQKLSAQRANAVYEYLVEQGINAERLTHKGYGMSKPIANNNTKDGRAQNRRTEMTIIKIE